jgi:biopolymer transport protein ExbD
MRIDLPRSRKRLISLTPLIDVVFILLIFFMLASNYLQWRSIELNTPTVSTVGSAMEGAILVRLKADGGLDLNGETLSLEGLGARVHTHLERNPDQPILVQPEGNVALQRIVTVLDRLAAVGGTHIALSRD